MAFNWGASLDLRYVSVKRTIFCAYSLWFRYVGLALAIVSGCVSLAIAFDIATHGYVLVNGRPSKEFASISGAVGIPLTGVVLGMALFLFVPKVQRKGGSSQLAIRCAPVHLPQGSR